MLRFYKIFILFVLMLFIMVLVFGGCKKLTPTVETGPIQVPPPERTPQEKDSIVVIDDIKFTISPYFWQDFMPKIPPGGPPFYLNFKIKVENHTEWPMNGFSALIATLYYFDTQKVFHNFRLIPTANTQLEETILPHERKTLIYTNDRKEIFSPQIKEGTKLFGRIMVKWNGKKYLLTSPPTEVTYTY